MPFWISVAFQFSVPTQRGTHFVFRRKPRFRLTVALTVCLPHLHVPKSKKIQNTHPYRSQSSLRVPDAYSTGTSIIQYHPNIIQ